MNKHFKWVTRKITSGKVSHHIFVIKLKRGEE